MCKYPDKPPCPHPASQASSLLQAQLPPASGVQALAPFPSGAPYPDALSDVSLTFLVKVGEFCPVVPAKNDSTTHRPVISA